MHTPDQRKHLTLKESLKMIEDMLLLGVPIKMEINSSGDNDKLQVTCTHLHLAQVEIKRKV